MAGVLPLGFMSKGEILTFLIGFLLAAMLMQSAWSGDWSWLLFALAGM